MHSRALNFQSYGSGIDAARFLQPGGSPIGPNSNSNARRRHFRSLAPCKNGCPEGTFTGGGTLICRFKFRTQCRQLVPLPGNHGVRA